MNKNNNISLQTIDYVIIGSAILLLLSSWIYIGVEYTGLPDQIPSHFNAKGEADDYSGKGILWMMTGTFTLITGAIFLIAKNTAMHNIRLKTKRANFRSVAIFMPFIAAIQAIIVYTIVQTAQGSFEYSKWMLPLIVTLTGVFLLIMFVIINKNKKS